MSEYRTIRFRPLRRVKKTGKIVVASYSQWRSIKSADQSGDRFKLIVDTGYRGFGPDERVFRHDGDDLFWIAGHPQNILNNTHSLTDCDGVPAFSHKYPDELCKTKASLEPLVPLTVEMVRHWFGWFLYNLERVDLEFAEPHKGEKSNG